MGMGYIINRLERADTPPPHTQSLCSCLGDEFNIHYHNTNGVEMSSFWLAPTAELHTRQQYRDCRWRLVQTMVMYPIPLLSPFLPFFASLSCHYKRLRTYHIVLHVAKVYCLFYMWRTNPRMHTVWYVTNSNTYAKYISCGFFSMTTNHNRPVSRTAQGMH